MNSIQQQKLALKINDKIAGIFDADQELKAAAIAEQERLAGEDNPVMEAYKVNLEILLEANIEASDLKTALRMTLNKMQKRVDNVVVRVKIMKNRVEADEAMGHVLEIEVENKDDKDMSETVFLV